MRKMRLLGILIAFLVLSVYVSNAQSNTVAAGGDASGVGGSASYTVGEIGTLTYTGNGGIVISGVQQPYSNNPLPISLSQFKATLSERKEVLLNWTTVSEFNNSYFAVEVSQDGIHFQQLNSVKSKGNSNKVQNYSAIDKKPFEGTSYYRLKQTDTDGKFTYSEKAIITNNLKAEISVYPNPTSNYAYLHLKDVAYKVYTYSIANIDGRTITTQKLTNNFTTINMTPFEKGAYLIIVKEKETIVQSFKIIKN